MCQPQLVRRLDDHTKRAYKTNYQVTAIFCSLSTAAEIPWSEAYTKAKVAVLQLTDEEKVTLGTGTGSGTCVGNTAAISKIGWPGLCLQDSPLAVRLAHNFTGGISGINTAATFDRDIVRQRAEDIGDEFRGKGVNVQVGPDVNMARIPEYGRNWEGFGEDPYLTGVMGIITVQVVQSKGVIATAKHFILNEQELDRTTSSSEADDRTIHELYTWPFARAVEAGVASVMCFYNRINGTYACENDGTLNTILKGELIFQGFVQSDCGATHSGTESAHAGWIWICQDLTPIGDSHSHASRGWQSIEKPLERYGNPYHYEVLTKRSIYSLLKIV
ncbi:unnamed protein product [Umbelopsis ramanniana]